MEIEDILPRNSVIANLHATSKKQLLQELSKAAGTAFGVEARHVFDILLERERLGSTGVGSGLAIPHRVESADEVARIAASLTRPQSAMLLTVPIPEADELDASHLDEVLAGALAECEAQGVTGAAITPFVLGRIGEATEGRSIPANLSLAENNAKVAADVAVAIAALAAG